MERKARGHRIDRRNALLAGVSLLGGMSLVSSRARASVRSYASRRLPASPAGAPRSMLLIQLEGGNDGLSTVIPYADDAYHRVRPTLARSADQVLALDDYVGLNSELQALRRVYESGKLAIVQGVGYPNPIRSHFRSLDIWHAASPRGRSVPTGWVGRLCSVAFGEGGTPNTVVHVGPNVPYSLHSTEHPPVSFLTPTTYRWVGDEDEREAYAKLGSNRPADMGAAEPESGSNLDYLRKTLTDGRDSSREVRLAALRYDTPIEYPAGPFAAALRDIAALANGDVGGRVFSVLLNGFDTHTDERGVHDRMMREVDMALGALLRDLERTEAGRNLIVVAFSEFGRRVAENGARGTDHGVAGPMFVAGHAVKGGLYGEHPSLTELTEGDLIHNVDFRSVYGTVIEKWFGVSHRDVLGERYPLLPLV